METRSRHLLLELHGCRPEALDDPATVRRLLEEATASAGATLLRTVVHQFSPQGVTGVAVIAESHLSIHTWPEAGYAACDFYTCGDCDPEPAGAVLAEGLGASRVERLAIVRGLGPGRRGPGVEVGPLESRDLDAQRAAVAASSSACSEAS
jgi:S-adenosylmethionine decarboxylase proenzyme